MSHGSTGALNSDEDVTWGCDTAAVILEKTDPVSCNDFVSSNDAGSSAPDEGYTTGLGECEACHEA